MKQFTKRAALVCGLLCTALLCMGIVYIDTTQNFWSTAGGFVRLTVSNNVSTITVSTNTPHGFGYRTNNILFSFMVQGAKPGTNSTGNGSTANNSGSIFMTAGGGGDAATNSPANAGSAGGRLILSSGPGGVSLNASSNASGGGGGVVQILGGNGGAPSVNASNTVGGAGGIFTFFSGNGGSPSGGAITRKGGNGGDMNFDPGQGGNSINTNGGNAGRFNIDSANGGTATGTGNGGSGGDLQLISGAGGIASGTGIGGNGGSALVSAGAAAASSGGGNAGAPGGVSIVGGNGAAGATNSNGGNVIIGGGSPGSGANAGNVLLGMSAAGTPLGNVGVGTNNPQAKLHVAGDIAMTGAALPAYLGASPTNNVQTTNWFGRVQASAAAVIEAAFNQFSELVVTNRIAAATTITLTNSSLGYADMTISLLGEIAGGTSRTVTLVANTGQLIANLDAFGTALATSYAFTLTNGNAVEISDELRQLNGTNVHKIVTRQFAF